MKDKEKEAIESIKKKLHRKADYDTGVWIAQNDLETVLNLIQTQQAKIEKKDKIIDEMAKYLASIDFDEHCVEVPGICIGCPKEDDLDGYMQCIKQYFERKVENE